MGKLLLVLRALRFGAAVVVPIPLAALTIGDALTFLFSYGNPAGSYTGQGDDRVAAWRLLGLAAVLWVLAIAILIRPTIRQWRNRSSA